MKKISGSMANMEDDRIENNVSRKRLYFAFRKNGHWKAAVLSMYNRCFRNLKPPQIDQKQIRRYGLD